MRYIKTAIISSVLIVTLAVTLLACASVPMDNIGNSNDGTSNKEVSQDEESAKTIKMITWDNDGTVNALNAINEMFYEETGIKVELEYVPSQEYEDFLKKEIESNEADIFCYTSDSKAFAQPRVDWAPMGPLREKAKALDDKKKFTFTAPKISVLAVDDTKINLKVISGILKPTQMKVDVCDSGAKCLELCQNNHYDIIFMDHMMPEMDGIETFNRLRADKESQSSDATVFVLTANTVAGAAEMYRECGFDYYFKKPIDIKELNDTLQRFIPKENVIPIDDAQAV